MLEEVGYGASAMCTERSMFRPTRLSLLSLWISIVATPTSLGIYYLILMERSSLQILVFRHACSTWEIGNGHGILLADIWSFGITALELAHGHAPFSKYPPMKVLLLTIQNSLPALDYDRDKKFFESFKEMVAMYLVKDQTKRPSADKLLKHSFFKNARPSELTVKKLFAGLSPLWNRVKSLQSEYQRGVSAWNFDVEDRKYQASMLQDDDTKIEEMKGKNDSSRWGFDFGKSGFTNGNICRVIYTLNSLLSEVVIR